MKDNECDFINSKINTIGFIGFGLIGGSIARAIKSIYPKTLVYAYNYHKNPPSGDLRKPYQMEYLIMQQIILQKAFQTAILSFYVL